LDEGSEAELRNKVKELLFEDAYLSKVVDSNGTAVRDVSRAR
jgi:hypothetical protein